MKELSSLMYNVLTRISMLSFNSFMLILGHSARPFWNIWKLYVWSRSQFLAEWCKYIKSHIIFLSNENIFCNEIFFCNKISFSVVVYWYMCHHGTLHRHGNIRLLFGFSPWNMWNISFNLIVTKILWNSENEAAIIF